MKALALPCLLLLAAGSARAAGDDDVLLFTYFRDNGQAGVCLCHSDDGVKFTPLNHDRPIFTPPAWPGQNLTRDASILYREGRFRMVWTSHWKGRVFGYADSPDLVHWSEARQVRPFPESLPAVDQPENVWAPEIHWDPLKQDYFILFSSTTPRERTDGDRSDNKGNNTSPYDNRIYMTRTKDGRQFGDARLFFDQGFSTIDAVMRVDERNHRWVMVVKNSRDFDLKERPGRNLWLTFTGPDLDHPQFSPAVGPIAGNHSPLFRSPEPKKSMAEGQSLLFFRDKWWLYWDEPAGAGIQLATSPDLEHWMHVREASFPRGAHHGTAFLVPRSAVCCLACPVAAEEPGRQPHAGNPIVPGYYADPSLVQHDGKFFLYATLDPWGGDTLGCWESADFKTWTYRVLNWPTAAACKSRTSGGAKVWAPSVVRAANGKFYMYVSVHNEVWVGTADQPLGPWRNALGDRPLVPGNFKPGYHMIDAEGFVDDDGTGWLYWGSGWDWKNGRCWAVRLKPDMVTFDGEVHDVTPANYFEGPFMVKRGGRYFLMSSNGITVKDTYRVHYAVGDNPLGPFVEPSGSPILVTDKANNVISPGHHAVFRKDGTDYILYHRHSIPFDPKTVGRQVCVDVLRFTPDGRIERVAPTHDGPPLVRGRTAGRNILPATASASSEAGPAYAAGYVLDDNYDTRWSAAPDAKGGWLQLDLGAVKAVSRQEIRFEFAWKPYRFSVQASDDGLAWRTVADHAQQPVAGSPIVIDAQANARYLRLLFAADVPGRDISIFEWDVLP